MASSDFAILPKGEIMRRKFAGIGLGLTVSALVVLATGPLVASASPSTPPVVNRVTLTVSSNGSTVVASKGELIVVTLAGDHLRWSEAQAIQSTPVLRLVSEGSTTTGASNTVFRVVNYGTAGLNATGTPICPSTGACPQYALLWHATVDVPVVDPPGPARS
jgi:hypothetical protein